MKERNGRKPCEYCGAYLPVGVSTMTRRIRSFHFAECKRKPKRVEPEELNATPHGPRSGGVTDEQVKQLAVKRGFKLSNDTGDDLKPYVYEFALDVIALAHEVKPLIWVDTDDASESGDYLILKDANLNWVPHYRGLTIYSLHDITVRPDLVCTTREQAKAQAQEDLKRRVLSRLVHGGV